ncbi:hypothetical protein RBSH_03755 [Rhodopirellula baltica SH28]|uniref:Uncharacterized protein n=1 Tax=Rhodopirellula baltica SH28 TaxID=993517 RepID=K5DDM3_RHOBT|nr:hypothetical protein RBSH_03755 [Rhodopirellula baltica SH28]
MFISTIETRTFPSMCSLRCDVVLSAVNSSGCNGADVCAGDYADVH